MSITQCPKCHYQRREIDTLAHPEICPACGIVYHKWLAKQKASESQGDEAGAIETHPYCSRRAQLWQLVTAVPTHVDPAVLWARVMTLGLFSLWGGAFIFGGLDWEGIGRSFMHNINLPFHEFGHVLFSPFGRFMMILGGSLFQVLLPLGLTLVFVVKQHDNFAGSITLWWCGQSFIDLSPYIADAPYRSLPLIMGMGEEYHDWGNLLTMINAMDSAGAIARGSFLLGSLIMVLALLWGGYILRLQKRNLTAL